MFSSYGFFFLLSFFLLFFPCLISAIAHRCLPYFHTWCGLSANLECRFEMCCTWLAEKKLPKIHRMVTITQVCRAVSLHVRHVSTSRKKFVKQQYFLHMSSQYGELLSTNSWDRSGVCGIPANFNGFRILASLLQRHRSLEANETLHDDWPSPELLH